MDHFLSEAKRLVQRLQHHDNAVDILIGETTNLQNKLIAMRQYKDEVVKMNQTANHRPKSTLILGSQLENQRIQSLEHENRELSVSLAEHQSALELIMNKYREQVLVMIKANGTNLALPSTYSQPSEKELELSEQIAEMALVMRKSALIDENLAVKEIETIRSLQVENDNLRELLNISGQTFDLDSRTTREDISTPNSPNSAIMQVHTPVIDSSVSHKDSGIYGEDYSPNFGVFNKGKKRKPLKSSKHVDNLESLFTPPSSSSSNQREIIEYNKTDETDHASDMDFSDHIEEEEQQHQMYTVEAFVEKDDNDNGNEDGDDAEFHKFDTSLTNDYLEEDMLIQDLKSILDQEMSDDLDSDPSEVPIVNTKEQLKDTVEQNLRSYSPKSSNSDVGQNDALEFLDNVLDLSENSDDEEEVIIGNDENSDFKKTDNENSIDQDRNETNPIGIHNNSNNSGGCQVDILKEDKQYLVSDPHCASSSSNEEEQETNESDVLDFLDSFDKEIEEDDFDSSELQSDAESEVTVVGASEEDDAMAMFDSMLDEETNEQVSDADEEK